MCENLDRRRVLATAGIFAATIAGCLTDSDGQGGTEPNADDGSDDESDDDGWEPDDGENGNGDDDSDGTGESDSKEGGEGEEDEGDEADEESNGEDRLIPPAIDYGESIDDFEYVLWYGIEGTTVERDEEEYVLGRRSLRVENDANVATIVHPLSSPIDLTGRHVSAAVKVEAPLGGRIETRLRAPTAEDRVVSTRRIPPALDDWFRIDFGITRGRGSPDLSDVREIRIEVVGASGTNVRFWVDDLRATDGVGESHAILAFYGGFDSVYDAVWPLLEERGWAAAVPVAPRSIGAGGRMDIGQLRRLRDAGWDVSSFPQRGSPLPEMTAAEQREVIEGDRTYLAQRGFPDGARHFFAPYHSIDGDTLEILREVHDTGFLFGGNSAGMAPTAPYTIPVINGSDYEGSRAEILRADMHDQLVVLAFEQIGDGGMSVEEFEAQLDRIESNDYGGGLNVITPSDLLDTYL